MNVIMKIVLTLVMMLVWGIGKEVAQKVQGSGFWYIVIIFNTCIIVGIIELWSGLFRNSSIFKSKDALSNNKNISVNKIASQHSAENINENNAEALSEEGYFSMINTMKSEKEYQEASDEKFYLQATEEVDEGKQDKALWAKCMALCEGDESKAKYMYIKYRVDISNSMNILKIEDLKNNEITRKRIENESKEQLIENKIDFYLKPDNKEELKDLLISSGIYYELYRGSYRVALDNNHIIHFSDEVQFHIFLKQKLPTLEGFYSN